MKYINRIIYTILASIFFWTAQVNAAEIKGTVVDEFSKPMAGVKVEYNKAYTITDFDGSFTIEKEEQFYNLTFTFPGYKSVTLSTEGDTPVNVTLSTDAHFKDETIQLGYTTQSRNSLSGSVATVNGEVLSRQTTMNLTQTLSGNLLGLNYFESDNNLFNPNVGIVSRGISTLGGRQVLIVIDGIVSPTDDYKWINPQELESVTLLKDASTTAIYGIQGANGVLVINTKRGHIGKPKTRFYYDHSFQQMTKRPMSYNSSEYATMRNQAAYNDDRSVGMYSQYSQEEVEGYSSGIGYYPNNKWVDMYLKQITQMQRVGIDVSGGSKRIRYYSQLGYTHQGSPFWTDDNQTKYNSTPDMHLIKARTNLDLNFNKYLSGYASINANMIRYRMPIAPNDGGMENNQLIYSRLQNLPPTIYGPTTKPNGEGAVVTTDKEEFPIYGILNRSGYNVRTTTNFLAQGGLNLDLSFLTKGLSISGLMAFQGTSAQLEKSTQDYQRQIRNLVNGYDTEPEFLDIFPAHTDTPITNSNSGDFGYNLNFFANMDYKRKFEKHHVSAKLYTFFLKQVLSNSYSGITVMPYNRHTAGLEVQYGYDNKYFIKFDMAYAGSDQFAPDNRYTTVPSISGAWVISNESFMESVEYITNLKLRASYGISANDQFPGGGRFLYMNYFSSTGAETLIGNPDITAEKMHMQNYGIDVGLLNSFSISFDYFNVNNNNMLISAQNLYPSYMGTNAMTIINKGKMTNKGWELSATYSNKLNKDLSFNLGAGISYSINKVINTGEIANDDYFAPNRSDGYGASSIFGYRVDYSNGNGFINTQQELDLYTPKYVEGGLGTPRLGDLIYKDLNNDGMIDEKDKDYLGIGAAPYYYSFTGDFRYKAFDFNFLAIAKTGFKTMMVTPPNSWDGIFTDIHRNAWIEERYLSGAEITYPALYIANSTSNQSSDYFLNNASFLTLRNVEIGYTAPARLSNMIHFDKIRITLAVRNLFTIDWMKSNYVDPQVANFNAFQPYRHFSIGISAMF